MKPSKLARPITVLCSCALFFGFEQASQALEVILKRMPMFSELGNYSRIAPSHAAININADTMGCAPSAAMMALRAMIESREANFALINASSDLGKIEAGWGDGKAPPLMVPGDQTATSGWRAPDWWDLVAYQYLSLQMKANQFPGSFFRGGSGIWDGMFTAGVGLFAGMKNQFISSFDPSQIITTILKVNGNSVTMVNMPMSGQISAWTIPVGNDPEKFLGFPMLGQMLPAPPGTYHKPSDERTRTNAIPYILSTGGAVILGVGWYIPVYDASTGKVRSWYRNGGHALAVDGYTVEQDGSSGLVLFDPWGGLIRRRTLAGVSGSFTFTGTQTSTSSFTATQGYWKIMDYTNGQIPSTDNPTPIIESITWLSGVAALKPSQYATGSPNDALMTLMDPWDM